MRYISSYIIILCMHVAVRVLHSCAFIKAVANVIIAFIIQFVAHIHVYVVAQIDQTIKLPKTKWNVIC